MNTAIRQTASSPLLMPIAALLAAMASIQAGAALAKGLFPLVGAAGAASLRLGFGTLLLLAVFRPWRTPMARGQWSALLAYGVSLGAMNLLFYKALETVPLGIAISLEFTGPLAVALLGSRGLREIAWVALAVLGLLLLLPGSAGKPLDLGGAACALAAGGFWALYIVYGQKAGAEHAGPQTVALGSLVAALVVLPFGIVHAGPALFAPALWPMALAVALLATALPYTLEMVALTRMPARSFGMLTSLEPVFGAMAGLLFLHEHLSLPQWLGIGAIILASAGAALGARKPVAVAGGEG